MKLGDIVKTKPMTVTLNADPEGRKVKGIPSGVVVYIHPKRRFYVLEYTARGGKFREAFIIDQPQNYMVAMPRGRGKYSTSKRKR